MALSSVDEQRSPFDPDTEYYLLHSDTPRSVDGYRVGEPKALVCAVCWAWVELTEDPSPGIDDLPHSADCPQRFVRSRWAREQLD